MVIHDISKVVSRQVVCGLIEHLIIEDIRVNHHFTADEVVHMHINIWLYLEANHILLTIGDACIYILLAECERINHLLTGASIVLEIGNLCALRLQLLWGIESNIGIARSQ